MAAAHLVPLIDVNQDLAVDDWGGATGPAEVKENRDECQGPNSRCGRGKGCWAKWAIGPEGEGAPMPGVGLPVRFPDATRRSSIPSMTQAFGGAIQTRERVNWRDDA